MKPKTNKERIRDCIIKQGVEHLASWHTDVTAGVIIYRRISKAKMQELAEALLRLRSVEVRVVTIHLRDGVVHRYEKNKQAVKLSKV
jgi:hypothetical protein